DFGGFVGRLLRLAEHAVLVGSMSGSLWNRLRLVVEQLGVRVVVSRPPPATIRLYSMYLGSSSSRLAAWMYSRVGVLGLLWHGGNEVRHGCVGLGHRSQTAVGGWPSCCLCQYCQLVGGDDIVRE